MWACALPLPAVCGNPGRRKPGDDSTQCVTSSLVLLLPILQSQINRKCGRRVCFSSSALGFVFMGMRTLECNYFSLLLLLHPRNGTILKTEFKETLLWYTEQTHRVTAHSTMLYGMTRSNCSLYKCLHMPE